MKKVIIILAVIIVLLISGIVGFVIWKTPKEVKLYQVDPGDAFITNVANSKYLVKADILIETSDKKSMQYMTANDYKVRDVIISTLRSKDSDAMMQSDIQATLEKEILQALSEKYELEGLEHIYFNEFVIQQ